MHFLWINSQKRETKRLRLLTGELIRGDHCVIYETIFTNENHLEVCLYFVSFCDKIDAYRKMILTFTRSINIVERCASILAQNSTK